MKEFVAEKFLHDKGFKDRIFNAVCTSGIEGWKKEGRKLRVTDKKADE